VSSSKTLPKKSARKRVFTIEEANATLPLVRAIVSDLVELSRDVIDRRERLSLLAVKRDRRPRDPYDEELSQMEGDLENDGRRLREYLAELRALGVEPTSAAEGVVDFPALIDGCKGFLCWKLDEAQVSHWHEPGEGYSQRKPVPSGGKVDAATRGGGRCAANPSRV
jgi:hypothetical protein